MQVWRPRGRLVVPLKCAFAQHAAVWRVRFNSRPLLYFGLINTPYGLAYTSASCAAWLRSRLAIGVGQEVYTAVLCQFRQIFQALCYVCYIRPLAVLWMTGTHIQACVGSSNCLFEAAAPFSVGY